MYPVDPNYYYHNEENDDEINEDEQYSPSVAIDFVNSIYPKLSDLDNHPLEELAKKYDGEIVQTSVSNIEGSIDVLFDKVELALQFSNECLIKYPDIRALVKNETSRLVYESCTLEQWRERLERYSENNVSENSFFYIVSLGNKDQNANIKGLVDFYGDGAVITEFGNRAVIIQKDNEGDICLSFLIKRRMLTRDEVARITQGSDIQRIYLELAASAFNLYSRINGSFLKYCFSSEDVSALPLLYNKFAIAEIPQLAISVRADYAVNPGDVFLSVLSKNLIKNILFEVPLNQIHQFKSANIRNQGVTLFTKEHVRIALNLKELIVTENKAKISTGRQYESESVDFTSPPCQLQPLNELNDSSNTLYSVSNTEKSISKSSIEKFPSYSEYLLWFNSKENNDEPLSKEEFHQSMFFSGDTSSASLIEKNNKLDNSYSQKNKPNIPLRICILATLISLPSASISAYSQTIFIGETTLNTPLVNIFFGFCITLICLKFNPEFFNYEGKSTNIIAQHIPAKFDLLTYIFLYQLIAFSVAGLFWLISFAYFSIQSTWNYNNLPIYIVSNLIQVGISFLSFFIDADTENVPSITVTDENISQFFKPNNLPLAPIDSLYPMTINRMKIASYFINLRLQRYDSKAIDLRRTLKKEIRSLMYNPIEEFARVLHSYEFHNLPTIKQICIVIACERKWTSNWQLSDSFAAKQFTILYQEPSFQRLLKEL